MKKGQSILAIAILNFCLLGAQAQITPAFQPPAGGPGVNDFAPNDPVNLGMVFAPLANISVNALGFYDTTGLTAGETVAIYDSSGNIVVQANVSLSNPLTDGYYWQTITPVVLGAGDTYTVDAFTGNNPWAWDSVPIVNSSITYLGQTYDYTGSLAFPTSTAAHAADAYYGPNISIVASSAPDGGLTALLLGVSTAGLGFLRRKIG